MITDTDNLLQFLPMIGLYAETHFRFGGWTPSLLFKREPEIIFDMPRRIENGKDVPILLQFNDFKKFPISIEKITLALSQNQKSKIVFESNDISKFEIKHNFSKNSPTFQFMLPAKRFKTGIFSITCKAEIISRKKRKIILNNNLRTSDKKSLIGYYANEKLPGNDKCIYGDMHIHSQYTESHVEFCPPIKAIDTAAAASGLDFLTITDHSYDISCSIDNYLKPDHNTERWSLFNKDLNDNIFQTVIIAGEEISVLNSEKKIVHLGGVGIKTFISGSADGARKQVAKIKYSPSINNASQSIHKDGGIAFAAHPGAQSGALQRIFLKRGTWKEKDISNEIDAFQAVNNGFRSGWFCARKLWINKLLEGRKLPLIAGNDSHGDFNRYISLKIPFMYITDIDERYLGYGKTGIYSNKMLDKTEITSYIKEGKTFVTTGPYIDFTDKQDNVVISNTPYKESSIILNTSTSEEYGQIETIRIFAGNTKKRIEDLLILKNGLNTYKESHTVNLSTKKEISYIRAEIICKKNGTVDSAMAATSPVYLY